MPIEIEGPRYDSGKIALAMERYHTIPYDSLFNADVLIQRLRLKSSNTEKAQPAKQLFTFNLIFYKIPDGILCVCFFHFTRQNE